MIHEKERQYFTDILKVQSDLMLQLKFFKCEVLKRLQIEIYSFKNEFDRFIFNFTDKNVKFKNEIFPVINVH